MGGERGRVNDELLLLLVGGILNKGYYANVYKSVVRTLLS